MKPNSSHMTVLMAVNHRPSLKRHMPLMGQEFEALKIQ
jgi:hypothetical protein